MTRSLFYWHLGLRELLRKNRLRSTGTSRLPTLPTSTNS